MGVRIRKALATVAIVATVATLAGGCSTAGDVGSDAPGDTDNTAAGGASTTAAAATTTDYRALPLEQRPEVFNPCEEITIAELEAAGFRDITPNETFEFHPANSGAHECSWSAYPMSISVVGSWFTIDLIRQLPRHSVIQETTVGDYDAVLYTAGAVGRERICHIAMETGKGLISMGGSRNIPAADPLVNEFDTCEAVVAFAERLAVDLEGN